MYRANHKKGLSTHSTSARSKNRSYVLMFSRFFFPTTLGFHSKRYKMGVGPRSFLVNLATCDDGSPNDGNEKSLYVPMVLHLLAKLILTYYRFW